MLKLYKPQFIERIMTSPTGERYRVVFQVTYVGGKAVAKVVLAEFIEKRLELGAKSYESDSSEILALPCASAIILSPTSYILSPALKVSPFTSLLFFTSQPTRAPSVA